jgi:hypothetical protein
VREVTQPSPKPAHGRRGRLGRKTPGAEVPCAHHWTVVFGCYDDRKSGRLSREHARAFAENAQRPGPKRGDRAEHAGHSWGPADPGLRPLRQCEPDGLPRSHLLAAHGCADARPQPRLRDRSCRPPRAPRDERCGDPVRSAVSTCSVAAPSAPGGLASRRRPLLSNRPAQVPLPVICRWGPAPKWPRVPAEAAF